MWASAWVSTVLVTAICHVTIATEASQHESCDNYSAKGNVKLHTPQLTSAALTESWHEMDTDAETIFSAFANDHTFSLFPHARDVFKSHLIGTFSILGQWGQPSDIARTGLFHTGYSGDLFQFSRWDPMSEKDRSQLRLIIGEEAETLTWLFGTLHRGKIANLSLIMSDDVDMEPLVPGSFQQVPHRLESSMEVSSEVAGKILMVTLADYLDQMVSVNGWRDHHQVEEPLKLYPGLLARPSIAFYWITKVCRAIRSVIHPVPNAFNKCTEVISRENEILARDSYWMAVQAEEDPGSSIDQVALLETVCDLNPFVGEPHFLLSQLAYREGDFHRSSVQARIALQKMFALGTAWDKRMSFQSWVAHTRMYLMRANRRVQGLNSLPTSPDQPPTSGGLPMVMLEDLIKEFNNL